MQVRRKPETAEAVQFDPEAEKWPPEIRLWDRFQPRDMSFGYVDTTIGRINIYEGDWIVRTDDEKILIVKDSIFKKIYEII